MLSWRFSFESSRVVLKRFPFVKILTSNLPVTSLACEHTIPLFIWGITMCVTLKEKKQNARRYVMGGCADHYMIELVSSLFPMYDARRPWQKESPAYFTVYDLPIGISMVGDPLFYCVPLCTHYLVPGLVCTPRFPNRERSSIIITARENLKQRSKPTSH